MKVIIAGCRNWEASRNRIDEVLEECKQMIPKVTEVICGMAPGIDESGRLWAEHNGIPVAQFPADWVQYGRSAGPIRNKAMALYCDAAVIFWDGKSRGTHSMIREMRLAMKPYTVFPLGSGLRLIDLAKGEKP